jgi:DNA polymerase-1
MEKIYILDAAGYIYRSYFAIRNMTNSKGESTNALYGFARSVLKLFKDFHPEYLVAVFDGPNNGIARKNLYPEYKAHRSAMPADLRYQIDWAHQFCELMGIPLLNVPNVEADDTMGSIAQWAAHHKTHVYLCTSDKDMCQLVNDRISILNTHKDNLILGPKEVEENFGVPPEKIIDLLAIIGDASDNVPGLTGFGPKTAASVLKEFGSLDNLLKNISLLPEKKQEVVRQEADQVRLSQKLVTIDTQVEFPQDSEFFRLKTPNFAGLREFYSQMSFQTLAREMETGELFSKEAVKTLPVEEVSYSLVDDEASLNSLIHTLRKHQEICFNIIAEGNHPLTAKLIGFGFCVEAKQAFYVPTNGKLGFASVKSALKPLFENPDFSFYGHNVKQNLHILKTHGITLAHIAFDTLLASYILNANQRQHSLDFLLMEYFGKVKTSLESLTGKGKKAISIENLPPEVLSLYVNEEVDFIYRLKEILQKQLLERNLAHLLSDIELPLLTVLAKMEEKGIYIDIPYLKEMSKEFAVLIRNLEDSIYQMAGTTFNINSPKQLSEVLFQKLCIKAPKKTATGLSTNAEVLESLKNEYPICSKLLEYRSLEKLRSTYIDSLPETVNPKTERIHCTFNQSGTTTGRLASQDPNLQNIPVRTEEGRKIRQAFTPQKNGWSYLSADYSQIELRLLAHMSEDPTLIKAFQLNEDIHRYTASLIFGIPLEEVSKELRYNAKAVNFGIVYGQQAFGLSQELGIAVKEAAQFIDMYFARYPKVKEYLQHSKDKARLTGKAVTMTGRERAIPEISSKNGLLRSAAERLAVNTPLQGTAADLIKLAMLKINLLFETKKLKSFMILQIHDELLFEVLDEELEEIKILVKQAMEGVWQLKVPLLVDINVGKNWAEC